ncbi:hypothetical protein GALL_459060 [mine drainage metagenome]|uniref:Uncharacterized protein n=1 Tax=mine drainage metagenome TaxID=410659 RepID=A0A1J5PMT8_9ZZZZ
MRALFRRIYQTGVAIATFGTIAAITRAARLIAIAVIVAALVLIVTVLTVLLTQLSHRLTQHAGVMFGVLQEVFMRHAVIGQLRIARQLEVFLDDLLRGAAHLAFGTRRFKDAVDDVSHRTRTVRLGTRS